MKRTSWLWGCMLIANTGYAQGFFKQDKTYLKQTGEQVALLYTYIQFLEKGYKIVSDGLRLINDIKHGDFGIHNSYFNSLKSVTPAIKKYSKVDEITDWYAQIGKLYKASTITSQSTLFSNAEREYIRRVWEQHLSSANEDLQQVKLLTSSGHYALKDDDRLQRIESVWKAMRDKYAFARDFANGISTMLVQKQREQRDVNGTGKMTDIKQ